MKPAAKDLLPIYRRNLARYEAEGDPKLDTQRKMVANLEARAAREAESDADWNRKRGQK